MFSTTFACFLLDLLVCKLDYVFPQKVAFGALLCLLLFVFFFLNPFHILYRTARYEMLRVMGLVLIVPFSNVRFKEFLLADVCTSLTKTFEDSIYTSCFFYGPDWLNSSNPVCSYTTLATGLIVIVPYWWRLMQCLVRYKQTKVKVNLVNVLKYSLSICVYVANIFASQSPDLYHLWVGLYIVSSIFSWIFDVYIDFGLWRTKE